MSTEPARVTFNEPLHSLGERLHVPTFALRQALGWSVGAELVRRHPNRIRLLETFPHQYGRALSPYLMGEEDRPGQLLGVFTYGREMHITLFVEHSSSGRFNWLDLLLAENRQHYVVRQLEFAFGLQKPSKTPPTQLASIGPRAIAAFLERSALGRDRWLMRSGTGQDDDDIFVNNELFRAMPQVAADLVRHRAHNHPWGLGESRYWFLCPIRNGIPRDPVLSIDVVDGIAWSSSRRTDLMSEYNTLSRRLDAVVSKVFPPAF